MNIDNRMVLGHVVYMAMYKGLHKYLNGLDLISPNKVTTPYSYFDRSSVINYYNNMGWDLIYDEQTNNCTISEKQLTFFLLTL